MGIFYPSKSVHSQLTLNSLRPSLGVGRIEPGTSFLQPLASHEVTTAQQNGSAKLKLHQREQQRKKECKQHFLTFPDIRKAI